MAKAFIFVSNNTAQTFTTTGTVAPGIAQHGFGCTCGSKTIQVTGDNINLNASGYYSVDVGAVVTDSDPGNVTLSLYQDGNLIASGSETIAAAADPANISFPAGILVKCSSVLTLVVTASAGNPTVNSVDVTIEKL